MKPIKNESAELTFSSLCSCEECEIFVDSIITVMANTFKVSLANTFKASFKQLQIQENVPIYFYW